CHETPHVLHAAAGAKGPQCSACHDLHSTQLLKQTDARVSRQCVSCHEAVHPSHAANAAACTSCHRLDKRATPAARMSPAALNQNCATCHKYTSPVHSSVPKGAPTCTDCHDYAKDALMPAGALAVSQRCGACHEDAMKAYRAGGHAQGLAEHNANRDLPNCVSCHSVHNGTRAASHDVRVAATTRCIQCHSSARLAEKYKLPPNVGASYTDDFHGATLQFQSGNTRGTQPAANVLTCSDCHGSHNVATRDKAQIAQVCQRCHEQGSVKLAGAWLGHAPPSRSNQIMVWLIRLFYYTLIPFVLIGLTLHIIFQIIDQRRKGARLAETGGMKRLRARLTGTRLPPERMVPRFSRLERFEHMGSMLTFAILVITGLPQTRPDLGIAHTMIDFFGGIGVTRIIHRTAGFLFVALLVRHVAHAILRALRTHRMPVMATNAKDFRDAFETVRHFLFGTPRPKTGKFDFSEKFEYWGMFMGGTLMSVTGVALVFPEVITQFLPGLAVAAFRVMHGLEATFAALVVALWHSYGVVLRPEVFPLDTSIFTGKISAHRLKEEHLGEYERLFPDEADAHDVAAEADDAENVEDDDVAIVANGART
ncbi:MAG TPA: cytochrome c3 family protein, partial [Longimicrobiales bacterium]